MKTQKPPQNEFERESIAKAFVRRHRRIALKNRNIRKAYEGSYKFKPF